MFLVGLIDQLGYRVPEANRLQRLVWTISSSRPGAWFFAKTLHHIDRLVLRLTRERVTVPGVLAGLPVITLATTGARTGQRREVPLVGVPSGDEIAVIGTRFGQTHTPGWYFNLRADPRAEVGYRGRTVDVVAREAEGDERAAVWARGCEIYAGYQAYARRIDHRQIHVMVLEPAPGG
jgi:deazaflavin-dependent oxidoreductase (nitroreductase family)